MTPYNRWRNFVHNNYGKLFIIFFISLIVGMISAITFHIVIAVIAAIVVSITSFLMIVIGGFGHI